MQLTITKAKNLKEHPDDSSLAFGTVFTDHMFNMDYNPEQGWHNPRIEPYTSIVLDPSTMVLHYGQAIFEGLKAFRTDSGSIQMFRPKDNISRFNRSAHSLCIPELDEALHFDMLKQLIDIDRDWVPKTSGTSLYIRPTIIATDAYLGVRASNTYRFFIILSPVGAYYPEGFNPVKIWVTRSHVRAVPGGVGEAKTSGNYAASLYAGEEASKNGYTQVLWLDGVEHKYVEEVGSMNIFFVIDDEIITPMLNGSILPGITRDSVITLAKKWNLKISERKISIDEVIESHDSGKLQEIFGTGTAAVISPVGELRCGDRTITIGGGQVGPIALKFFDAIAGIQYGKIKDTMGWVEQI